MTTYKPDGPEKNAQEASAESRSLDTPSVKHNKGRRKVVLSLSTGAAVPAAYTWVKPVVESVTLPAHAQTTPGEGGGSDQPAVCADWTRDLRVEVRYSTDTDFSETFGELSGPQSMFPPTNDINRLAFDLTADSVPDSAGNLSVDGTVSRYFESDSPSSTTDVSETAEIVAGSSELSQSVDFDTTAFDRIQMQLTFQGQGLCEQSFDITIRPE